jgi:hypothetical protein
MTYHTVFEISERIPQALLALPASACLAMVVILWLRSSWRPVLRRSSWTWLGAAALLWSAFVIPNIGGWHGWLFGGVFAAIALLVALPAYKDAELRLNPHVHPRARAVAPIGAAAMLAVVAYGGFLQWPAFGLRDQLDTGDVTVVTGIVENHENPNWGTETFTVDGHIYSYGETPGYVGFHQTAANGGPIRDGLQVRVTSVGDVIVRLEVADQGLHALLRVCFGVTDLAWVSTQSNRFQTRAGSFLDEAESTFLHPPSARH